jgi:hypothetical protein
MGRAQGLSAALVMVWGCSSAPLATGPQNSPRPANVDRPAEASAPADMSQHWDGTGSISVTVLPGCRDMLDFWFWLEMTNNTTAPLVVGPAPAWLHRLSFQDGPAWESGSSSHAHRNAPHGPCQIPYSRWWKPGETIRQAFVREDAPINPVGATTTVEVTTTVPECGRPGPAFAGTLDVPVAEEFCYAYRRRLTIRRAQHARRLGTLARLSQSHNRRHPSAARGVGGIDEGTVAATGCDLSAVP